MSIREDFLKRRLTAYLDRRSMPRGFEGKPAARDAELEALTRCVLKFAPRERYDEWFNRFEDTLAEDAKTRAWPTEGEIKSAARAIRPTQSRTVVEGDEIDPVKIAAGRINRGEAVGDSWLWGRLALELLASGEVSLAQIRAYRSAVYFAEKKMIGDEVAKAREEQRGDRHRAAEKGLAA